MPKPPEEQQFYSEGVESLLAYLQPDGRPEGNMMFPRGYDPKRGRIGNEEPKEWFCRVVREQPEWKIGDCEIEPHVAVVGEVRWNTHSDAQVLSFASLQVLALVPESASLTRLVEDGPTSDCDAHYFRLDYDLDALGAPFTHPMPHVHTSSGDAPRFAQEWSASGCVVVDFLDFLYRNYHHSSWAKWADAVWVDQLEESEAHGMLDQFTVISAAFKNNQHQAITTLHLDVLRRMKTAWRDSRDAMYALKAEPRILDAFSYCR